MKLSEYRHFFENLKKTPTRDRKKYIDATIESLGYRMNRIPVPETIRKGKWIVEVSEGNRELFNDPRQIFSLAKAIEISRIVALTDYEESFR